MFKKECRIYYFSVEGETEKWYLEWLQGQINSNENARYNVKFILKVEKNPKKMIKKINVLSDIEILHVFDFEELFWYIISFCSQILSAFWIAYKTSFIVREFNILLKLASSLYSNIDSKDLL